MRSRRGLRTEDCGLRTVRDHELPGIRYVLDTRRGEDVRGVGHAEGDVLVSYHVTDRPVEVVRFLKRRGALVKAYGEKGRTAELGPGFYASGVPDYWISRARGKWAFLTGLDKRSSARLTHALRQKLLADRRARHITASELARGVRTTRYVDRELFDASALTELATQPYAIPFWKPEFLSPLGIAPGSRPGVVELRVRGLFAELTRTHPEASVLRTLRRAGLQGAFMRSGMVTNPELVVWDPRAIVSARVETSTERDPRKRRRRGLRTVD